MSQQQVRAFGCWRSLHAKLVGTQRALAHAGQRWRNQQLSRAMGGWLAAYVHVCQAARVATRAVLHWRQQELSEAMRRCSCSIHQIRTAARTARRLRHQRQSAGLSAWRAHVVRRLLRQTMRMSTAQRCRNRGLLKAMESLRGASEPLARAVRRWRGKQLARAIIALRGPWARVVWARMHAHCRTNEHVVRALRHWLYAAQQRLATVILRCLSGL